MISVEFEQNVKIGDLLSVRSALVDYLIIDSSFESFDEAFDYAKKSLNIIEKYDGKPFEKNSEKWDINYLNKQKVALMINFSSERIEHIKSVIRYVSPVKGNIKNTNHNKFLSQKTSENSKSRSDGRLTEYPVSYSSNTNYGDYKEGKSKTERKIIRETEHVIPPNNEKSKKVDEDFIGTTMIIGGTAVTVVGVAILQPIITGTGVLITGAGVAIKIKNKK